MKTIVIAAVVLAWAGGANATVLSPEGRTADYLGAEIFATHAIEVHQEGNFLVVVIETRYPGPHAGISDNIADLEVGGMAVKLSASRRGLIIYHPTWGTSEMFSELPVEYGRGIDGSFIPVQARGGAPVGQADVDWGALGDGEYLVVVKIPLEVFRETGIRGRLKIRWATAYCANSVVETEYTLEGEAPPRWGGGGPGLIVPTIPPVMGAVPYVWGGWASMASWGGSGVAGNDYERFVSSDQICEIKHVGDQCISFHHGEPPHQHHPVPIPGTAALMASGLFVLWLRRGKAAALVMRLKTVKGESDGN